VTSFVRSMREHDPGIQFLATEATIRVAYDEIYVHHGIPSDALQEAVFGLWRHLSAELLTSADAARDLIVEAESMFASIAATGALDEALRSHDGAT
jgi:hypothetical protein